MPRWWSRPTGGRDSAPDRKNQGPRTLFALSPLLGGGTARKGFVALTEAGYGRNPVAYRCIRLIAQGAARVPLEVMEGEEAMVGHPLAALLERPNRHQTGTALMEAVYTYLLTAGNAYLDAGIVDGEVKALHGLRPDRVAVIAGGDGWPIGYGYTAGGRTTRLMLDTHPVGRVLHVKLFHPLDDHYGMAPLEAAQMSLETHEAASRWNKALLENAARPSGALVYNAGAGNLTDEQYRRLRAELEEGFMGAAHAGRPMVLEGGLDWKALSLSPRDMDFLEARHAAAREIALAFGVPPMLLGIPGDNTYSNYAEASRSLWRQTIIPLVKSVSASLTHWLSPAFDGARLVPDFDVVEALAHERAADWARVDAASFLSQAEKREILGFGRTEVPQDG